MQLYSFKGDRTIREPRMQDILALSACRSSNVALFQAAVPSFLLVLLCQPKAGGIDSRHGEAASIGMPLGRLLRRRILLRSEHLPCQGGLNWSMLDTGKRKRLVCDSMILGGRCTPNAKFCRDLRGTRTIQETNMASFRDPPRSAND